MALTSAAARPTDFASQLLYSNYIKGFANNYNMTGWPSWRTNEHNSLMNFVPRSGATKVFVPQSAGVNVNSGNWNVAGNWYPNGVPTTNDKVLIGEGVTCTYDIESSSPDLTWIRLDGTLYFRHTHNAHLLCDTVVATESGMFKIGEEATPLQADKVITFEVSLSRGAIDVVADTFKQSRGFVWMGKSESGGGTRIYGQPKTHALRVASHTGPLAGATTLTLESAPTGWRVGDEISIPATRNRIHYNGYRDSLVTITNINGTVITFTPALTYDSKAPLSPWPDQQPKVWVRNLTRNVKFTTKNATNLNVERWGHTMFMHTNDVICEYAEFSKLGRTVKLIGPGFLANVTTAAGNPMPLGGEYYSAGDSAVIFPTEGWLVATGYGNEASGTTFTFTGEDAAGNAMSETVTFTANSNRTAFTTIWHINDTYPARTEKFFKKITSVTSNQTNAGSYPFMFVARNFRMTGSGVRIPRGGMSDNASASWIYDPVDTTTNIQGRYSFHMHRGGSNLAEMLVNGTARGCVSRDSFAWGYAHHDTHFSFIDCIAYRVSGAGFVGERGGETGVWEGCHASIVFSGDGAKPNFAPSWNDAGSGGTGFWWAGRAVGANNNVADNCNHGFVFNARFAEAMAVHTDDQLDMPEAYRGMSPSISASSPHIQSFKNNEVFTSMEGMHVIKANPLQETSLRTLIDGFFVWNTQAGTLAEYTAHYTWKNITIIYGDADYKFGQEFATGLSNNLNTDHVWIRPRVSGYSNQWQTALSLNHDHFGGVVENDPRQLRIVVDGDLQGGSYKDVKPFDRFLSSASLPNLDPPVSIDFGLVNPTPGYVTKQFLTRNSQAPFNDGSWTGWRTHGGTGQAVFTDRLGSDYHPLGVPAGYQMDWTDIKSDSEMNKIVARDGFRVNTTDGQKYVFVDEIYVDRLTGENFKEVIPCLYNTYNGPENRGSTTISNTTKPTSSNFSVSTQKNTSIQIAPLSYAAHPNNRQVMLRGNTQPRYGFVVRDGFSTTSPGTGTLTYVPQRGFTGTDSFKYWIMDQDGNLASNRGHTVTVTVSSEAPPAFQVNPDSTSTDFETQVVFNVLSNDIGTGLTVINATITSGGGTLSFAAGGNLTYTPAADFTGTATGTATVRDVTNATQESAWSVFVRPDPNPPVVDQPPVVPGATTFVVRKDKLITFNATAGATDPQGGPLTVTGFTISDPSKVTVVDVANNIVYLRPINTGSVTIEIQITNTAQLNTNRTLNLTITGRGKRFGKV